MVAVWYRLRGADYGSVRMMKFDPFYLLGAFGLTGVAAVHRDGAYALDFMAAIATGGFCALLFSLWKSRQRTADGIDTSLWALIGLIGSMGLAFFLAPSSEKLRVGKECVRP